MIEQGEFYLAIIGLFVLYIILNMRSHGKLLDLLDELAFPSDDPIMTSSLKDPVFDYEEPEEEEIPLDDSPEEAVELTPEEEDVIDEVMAKEEPEVFEYEETPKAETITDFQESVSTLYEVGNYTPSGEATLRTIKGMRKDDVIGICEIHGLDTEGTKAQLIERIKQTA